MFKEKKQVKTEKIIQRINKKANRLKFIKMSHCNRANRNNEFNGMVNKDYNVVENDFQDFQNEYQPFEYIGVQCFK